MVPVGSGSRGSIKHDRAFRVQTVESSLTSQLSVDMGNSTPSKTDRDALDEDCFTTDDEEEFRVDVHTYKKTPLRLMTGLQCSRHENIPKETAGFKTMVKRYNFWMAVLGDTATFTRPWTHGEKAARTKEEVDVLYAALNRKVLDLSRHVKSFISSAAIYADDHWYRKIEDLTGEDLVLYFYAWPRCMLTVRS